MSKKRINIILYGNKNQGKTTTLVRLAIMLASGGGINPLIESQVNRKFKKRKGYKDARFVIEYKEKLIFLCTGGDSWMVSRGNCGFFTGRYNNLIDVFRLSLLGLEELGNKDKEKYKKLLADFCICACRPNGDGYGAIKAIHSYNEKSIMDYSHQIWTRKERNMDNDNTAKEILSIIDEYI